MVSSPSWLSFRYFSPAPATKQASYYSLVSLSNHDEREALTVIKNDDKISPTLLPLATNIEQCPLNLSNKKAGQILTSYLIFEVEKWLRVKMHLRQIWQLLQKVEFYHILHSQQIAIPQDHPQIKCFCFFNNRQAY